MRGLSEEDIKRFIRLHNIDEEHNWIAGALLNECHELDPWLPIENMPKKGRFIVYMPEESTLKLQIAYNYENINIIGNSFAFDLSKPTHYKIAPQDPTDENSSGT